MMISMPLSLRCHKDKLGYIIYFQIRLGLHTQLFRLKYLQYICSTFVSRGSAHAAGCPPPSSYLLWHISSLQSISPIRDIRVYLTTLNGATVIRQAGIVHYIPMVVKQTRTKQPAISSTTLKKRDSNRISSKVLGQDDKPKRKKTMFEAYRA